jgi:hypothetical protein
VERYLATPILLGDTTNATAAHQRTLCEESDFHICLKSAQNILLAKPLVFGRYAFCIKF